MSVFSSLPNRVRVAEHFDYRTRCLLRWKTCMVCRNVMFGMNLTPNFTRIKTLVKKKASAFVYDHWLKFHFLHFNQTFGAYHRIRGLLLVRQRLGLIFLRYAMPPASEKIMQSPLKSTQTCRANTNLWLMRVSQFQINSISP